jgi:hypothetical protein
MAIVRNRKSAPISLPLKGDPKRPMPELLTFKPGEHEYPEEKLERLDMSRKAVRAYFEAPKNEIPPLEVVTDDSPRQKAAELVEMIQSSENTDWLREVLDKDDRKTVRDAAEKRLNDLTKIE